jgi:hypothetical protein
MIRVKLPSAASFHCSPSGDTEYEDAYRKAIFEKIPEDFEVIWPLLNQKTPTDSEGFTWIRIRYNGTCAGNPQMHWIQECQAAQKELRELKSAIRKLPLGNG